MAPVRANHESESLTPLEVESLSDHQKSARQAYSALIARVSVFVLAEGPRPDAETGSGLLLSTRKGVPFLLSARHVFEHVRDPAGMTIANPSVVLESPCERIFLAPLRKGARDDLHQHVDVAVVALRADARAKLAGIAGATIAADSEEAEGDVVVLAGFPSFLSTAAIVGRRIDYHLASIAYITGIQGRDGFERLCVEWHEARNIWENPEIPHYKVPRGQTFELGHPRGISGGGLWRVRGPRDKTALWAPSSHCQLVGIPVAALGRTSLVEPVELWRAWLDDVEHEINCLAGLT
jgi:hypothetical protein